MEQGRRIIMWRRSQGEEGLIDGERLTVSAQMSELS